jgi:hypothetical protein
VSCLSDVESATKGNCGVDAHADDADIVLAVLMMTAVFPRDSRISDQAMWVKNTLRVWERELIPRDLGSAGKIGQNQILLHLSGCYSLA